MRGVCDACGGESTDGLESGDGGLGDGDAHAEEEADGQHERGAQLERQVAADGVAQGHEAPLQALEEQDQAGRQHDQAGGDGQVRRRGRAVGQAQHDEQEEEQVERDGRDGLALIEGDPQHVLAYEERKWRR